VRCHAATGDHSAQHIILLGVGLARQEERQFLVLLRRLPGTEQLHRLRQVPYSSGGGITPRAARRGVLHQAGFVLGLPPSLDAPR
jgi:hypothetical protein